jgi:uncharacterized membrane protein YjgN (DUF898 family)
MNELIAPPPFKFGPDGHRAQILFTGEDRDFRQLVTRGALLELVTFGFYRFWLTTRIRRHLWAHTQIDGDAFEYTGTGRELLIGFLFALAILVPIYLAYFLIGIEAEHFKAFASLPLFVFFYAFAQFAVYRARRYRLTRTVWRGARFWMKGSGIAYAWRAFWWGALTLITLGLAYPWREAALERYKMKHTFYGDLQGHFAGTGWTFFKRGWWLWLLTFIPIIGYTAFLGLVGYAVSRSHAGVHDKAYLSTVGFGFIIAMLSLTLLPFIYPAFKATEYKWWAEGIGFGELRCDCSLSRGDMIGNYWKMIGISMLVSTAAMIVIGVIAGIGAFLLPKFGVQVSNWGLELKHGHFPPLLVGYYIFSYFSLFLALGIVQRIYLVQRIWKLVTVSIRIKHLEAIDNVRTKGDLVSALGEGLADGLDVAGF